MRNAVTRYAKFSFSAIVADSDAKEDMVVVQAGATEFKRMPIGDVMVPVKLVYEFDCGEAGLWAMVPNARCRRRRLLPREATA